MKLGNRGPENCIYLADRVEADVSRRFLLAKPVGEDDSSGIVLPDFGPSETALRRAAELLSRVNAVPMREEDIELKPFAPANKFLRETLFSSPVKGRASG